MIEVLRLARRLMANGHCVLTLARDRAGRPCSMYSPTADAFCYVGAMRRAAVELGVNAGPALDFVRAVNPYAYSPIVVNDRHGKHAILALMDLAIEKAQHCEVACPIGA